MDVPALVSATEPVDEGSTNSFAAGRTDRPYLQQVCSSDDVGAVGAAAVGLLGKRCPESACWDDAAGRETTDKQENEPGMWAFSLCSFDTWLSFPSKLTFSPCTVMFA
jgi:hypothetical protein